MCQVHQYQNVIIDIKKGGGGLARLSIRTPPVLGRANGYLLPFKWERIPDQCVEDREDHVITYGGDYNGCYLDHCQGNPSNCPIP